MHEPAALGEGAVAVEQLAGVGQTVVIEAGVRIFCPASVRLGDRVYLGHHVFLRAYPDGQLEIGDGSWLGPGCFVNSYGGVVLGRRVGLGPGVHILSSVHQGGDQDAAIMDRPLVARPVHIEDGADIGAGAILLPGAHIGRQAQVGAGAVVKGLVAAGQVVAGVPARLLARPE